eukprot:3254527-Prymnesium_polylepis.1
MQDDVSATRPASSTRDIPEHSAGSDTAVAESTGTASDLEAVASRATPLETAVPAKPAAAAGVAVTAAASAPMFATRAVAAAPAATAVVANSADPAEVDEEMERRMKAEADEEMARRLQAELDQEDAAPQPLRHARLMARLRAERKLDSFRSDVQDVFEYGIYLGMDLEEDFDLLWIADEALQADDPEGWTFVDGADGGHYLHKTGSISTNHPLDSQFQLMYLSEKAKLRRANAANGKTDSAEKARLQQAVVGARLLLRQNSNHLAGARWAEQGGAALNEALACTQLIRAEALVALAKRGERMPRCQDWPAESVAHPDDVRKGAPSDILCLSICWLDKNHPDISGRQLAGLLPVFESFIAWQPTSQAPFPQLEPKAGCPKFVLWDYCSLPQRALDGTDDRDENLIAKFKSALGLINVWYAVRRSLFEHPRCRHRLRRIVVERLRLMAGCSTNTWSNCLCGSTPLTFRTTRTSRRTTIADG